MNKKKIVIITTRFFPDIGGIEKSMYYFAKGFVENGFIVQVICTGNKDEKITVDDIHIVRRKALFKFSGNDINPFIFKDMLDYCKDADIIILNEPNPFSNSIFLLINFFLKKKYFVYYHSDIIRFGIFKILKLSYQYTFQRILLENAEKIITTTQRYQEISDTLNCQKYKKKFAVIPCTVDLAEMEKNKINENEKTKFKKELNLENRKIILFVGRFIYYKGLEYLIRAFRLVKEKAEDTFLILVGKGPLEKIIFEEANINNLQEDKDFIILRDVDDKQLSKIYQISDLFVLPSIYRSEAFGIVLLEAMAYQVPIVTTSISGTKEVAEEVGLIVEPKNHEKLAEAILLLLNDDKLKEKFRINANKKIKNFDRKKVIEEFITLIRDELK
ncbi:MAG: glycosyltransferase [Candidatus Aenigmatarchaeota archaeon]